jgi:hypothetical protein
MVLIKRTADNEIMNDRQQNDANDRALQRLRRALDSLPKEGKGNKRILEAQIKYERDAIERYHVRRCENAAKQSGGIPGDYETIPIEDDQIPTALSATYITCDAQGRLAFRHDRPYIEGSKVILPVMWVQGSYRLEAPDVTDFALLEVTERTYWTLRYYRKMSKISVELFLRQEFQDFANEELVDKVFVGVAATGYVDPDGTVTLL